MAQPFPNLLELMSLIASSRVSALKITITGANIS